MGAEATQITAFTAAAAHALCFAGLATAHSLVGRGALISTPPSPSATSWSVKRRLSSRCSVCSGEIPNAARFLRRLCEDCLACPWEWPMCVTYGAIAGHLIGMVVSMILIVAHNRRVRVKAD